MPRVKTPNRAEKLRNLTDARDLQPLPAALPWSPKNSADGGEWQYWIFNTDLGHMAIVARGRALTRLLFGFRTAVDLHEELQSLLPEDAKSHCWNVDLVHALRNYAAGKRVDFSAVEIAWSKAPTRFVRAVVLATRSIPYGQRLSYSQLARLAGYAGAARAVGNVMQANPLPLVVPCHRVVRGDGKIGRYSAPGGSVTKKYLLAMESAMYTPEVCP